VAHPGKKKRENLKYLSLGARIILKWIFKEQDERIWNGFSRFGVRTSSNGKLSFGQNKTRRICAVSRQAACTLKCDASCRPRQRETAATDVTIVFDSPQIKATPFPWHSLRLIHLFITSIISAYTFIFLHANYVRDLLRHPSVNEYLSFIGGPPISPCPA